MSDNKKGFVNGFKEFISRGNAVELAVGVVIGAAFGDVVKSIVQKFLNPLVAGIFGKPNFDNVLQFHLGDAVVQPGAIITALVNFLLVALAVYLLVVMPMNKLNDLAEARKAAKKAEEEAAAKADPTPSETDLLIEIRDLLSKQ